MLDVPSLNYSPGFIETTESLEIVQADLVSVKKTASSKDWIIIMTVKDHFSRFASAKVLINKKSATTASFINEIINEWGKPKTLQTDNGKEFQGDFTKLLSRLNIKHTHGRIYHPQSQGSIESFNKYFKNQLNDRFLENRSNLAFDPQTAINQILYHYNIHREHTVTKMTPADLFKSNDQGKKLKALERIRKKNSGIDTQISYPNLVLITNKIVKINYRLQYQEKKEIEIAGLGNFDKQS